MFDQLRSPGALRSAVVVAMTAAFLSLTLQPGIAQNPPPAATSEITIGYLDLADDPRFDPDRAYFMVPVRPFGRALAGAQLGIADAVQIGQVIHVNFTLREAAATDIADAVAKVTDWAAEGIHFVLVDLPGDMMLQLSDAAAGLPVTLFNLSAHEDTLRGADCRFNTVHVTPSFRMLTDAMVQFLVSHQWRNILVLRGPAPEDLATVEALRQSATFFGARIVDIRDVILSNDPRNREQSNIALVTAGGGYDVVYVADADGEFARFVPYETNQPRPVVGSAGLVATAWTWAYQIHGSSEVTYRFEQMAGRHMDDIDWAAWVAVRTIVQSTLRSQSTEYQAIIDYLLGDRLNVDGGKGNPMSVRPWDHQMRQAIPLATGNAVLDEAPITGFLHDTNDLDTLGVDRPQSTCRF